MSGERTGESWLRQRRTLVAAAALVAIAGHVMFWYLPRDREVRPAAEGAPYRLWSNAAGGHRIWLAHPHQSRLGRALVRLAVPELAVGPLPFPPSREAVIVVDRGETTVVARLYPATALALRMVMRLGLLERLLRTASESPVSVGWEGRSLKVRLGRKQATPRASPVRGERFAVALQVAPPGRENALVMLDAEQVPEEWASFGGWWLDRPLRLASGGAGRYELVAVGAEDEPSVPRGQSTDSRGNVAADAVDGLLLYASIRDGDEVRSIVIAAAAPSDRQTLRLPSSAVISSLDAPDRPSLPGAQIVRALGSSLHEMRHEDWRITAVDETAVAAALGVIDRGVVARPERLRLVVRPGLLERQIEGTADFLAESLLVAPRVARRWRAWQRQLERLRWVRSIEVTASEERLVVALEEQRDD